MPTDDHISAAEGIAVTAVAIDDGDGIARSLYSPKDVVFPTAGLPQLVPLNENNLQFTSDSDRKESVNCLRLLDPNSIEKCHTLGVEKQDRDNERNQKAAALKGKTPIVRTYVGYTQAVVGEVKASGVADITFDVIHEAIEGNAAHCNIHLICDDGVEKKFKQAAIKRVTACFKTGVNHP